VLKTEGAIDLSESSLPSFTFIRSDLSRQPPS